MSKGIMFISGPYRGDNEWEVTKNIRNAELVALKYWKKGYVVICPHKNSSYFGGELPDERWLKGDLEILSRCDGIVMMRNWKDSEGAMEEWQYAKSHGMNIIYDVYTPERQE